MPVALPSLEASCSVRHFCVVQRRHGMSLNTKAGECSESKGKTMLFDAAFFPKILVHISVNVEAVTPARLMMSLSPDPRAWLAQGRARASKCGDPIGSLLERVPVQLDFILNACHCETAPGTFHFVRRRCFRGAIFFFLGSISRVS